MRVIGYVRVSTDKQENSADAQEKRIRALAILHDHELIDVAVDFDEFSGNLDRPGVQRVIAAVNAKQVDAVIVTKLDRLTRSTSDAIGLLEMFSKKGVELIDISQAIDRQTAIGRFIFTIRAALGELERGMISERTSEGLQNLKSQGFPAGPAPYGFTAQPRTEEEKRLKVRKSLQPNETEQAIIGKIRAMSGQNFSYQKIADTLNAAGFRTRPSKGYPEGGPWGTQSVYRIVKDMDKRPVHAAEEEKVEAA